MKKWILREQIPEEANKKMENQPELIRPILFYRGIENFESAENFLNPDYEKHLRDPFLMLDMEKAVDRILQAITSNEKIIIYSDYDADGVCAAAVFHDFFKKIGFENFHVHIPDRNLDGYGLVMSAIDEFAAQKAGLIITLDCGITDFEEIEKANENGIDVIIIDHHLVLDKVPKAFAIIDSKQENDSYPFKYLCGAGAAFKTVQAIIRKNVKEPKVNFVIGPGWEKWLLDVVALATVADMAPLTDENRVLVYYGLKVMRRSKRPGLIALFRRLGLSAPNITEDDIAFSIAPRINIAGRMEHANYGFNLLVTQSVQEANWISGHLEMLNLDRRSQVDQIFKKVDIEIEKAGIPDIIVSGDKNWNPGVLGLAANRIMENYGKPVFLWGKGESKEIKGSCRSDGSINLVEFMQQFPKGIFLDFGGHAMAGGFSVHEGNSDTLKLNISRVFARVSKNKVENEILYIDKEIKIDDINEKFYSQIEKMQPFGIDNFKPVFMISNFEIHNAKKFGNGGIHLQLDFKQSDGKIISAIGFFYKNGIGNLKSGMKIDMVFSLEKSYFRLPPELRMRIIDVRLK